MVERPHFRLVATSARPDTLHFLRSTFVDEQTLPLPEPAGFERWLHRLQVRHLLLLESARELSAPLLRAVTRKQITISAVNVGPPNTLAPHLLDAARQPSSRVHLCVLDEATAQQLLQAGVPASGMTVTGCLHLDDRKHAPAKMLRRLVGLEDHTFVCAALDVPPDEENRILDAFSQVKLRTPDLRLLFEPRHWAQHHTLVRKVTARGWSTSTQAMFKPATSGRWDILLPSTPGEFRALLPLASVAIVGGTHSSGGAGAVAATAAAAGIPVLIGPNLQSNDLSLAFLNQHPALRLIQQGTLANELTKAIGGPVTVSLRPSSDSDSVHDTFAALAPILPQGPQLPPGLQEWRIPHWRDRLGMSKGWRTISAPLTRRRINTWEELGDQLGNPSTVLCLGNGPSSEDPRLSSFAHNCLMRVNWRWKSRDFLVNPDLVFVGDPRTIHKVHGAIFGIWNEALEQGMLLRHLVTRGPVRMRYFTMERLSPLVRDHDWPARPTNGALMIAAAAALNPERLIIAGVDLYLHAEGRYPGDLLGENIYCRAHTRETDLNLIRLALAEYRGELIILGDSLREALEIPAGVGRD